MPTMEASLQKFVSVNEDLMKELRRKRDEVENHQKACLVAKTVGTSTNTVGTTLAVIGVLGAPFTGGASLAFTVGGLAATGVGVTTNVVTEAVDCNRTGKFTKQIEAIIKVRDEVLRELADHLEAIAKKVENGVEAGLDRDMSLRMAFVSAWNGTSRLSKPLVAGRAVDVGIIHIVPKVVHVLKPGMAHIGLRPSVTLLGLTGRVIGAAAKGFAVVGVAVQVWEIQNLVEQWQTNHPTVEAIDGIMQQVTEETNSCKELLLEIQKIKEDQVIQPLEHLAPVLATKNVLQSRVEPVVCQFREDPDDYLELVKKSHLHEAGQDIRKLTEYLLVYALVTDAMDDENELPKEKGEMEQEQSTGNKETKALLLELLSSILKKAEVAWEESKNRKNKRGNHVINLGILSVCPVVIGRFMVRHRLDQHQVRDGAAILLDMNNPLGTEAAVIRRMVVYFDDNRPPGLNAIVYGRVFEVLIDSCLNHMNEIYVNPFLGRTSRYSAMVRELVNQIVTRLLFVDQPARDTWCAASEHNAKDYERVTSAVIHMLQNLHDKLGDWVLALRNARDGT